MKKVLIIGFRFPPTNSIGAVRVGKLAKYLPEFGWEPMVLTAEVGAGVPQTLPVEIDESRIVRTPSFSLQTPITKGLHTFKIGSAGMVPEAPFWSRAAYKIIRPLGAVFELPIIGTLLSEPIGWYFHAVKEGLKILDKENIDVLFSSSLPKTSHLIAAQLHQKTKIPWVAEYRDLWVNPYNNRSRGYDFFDRKLEKTLMQGCGLLITVSESTVEELKLVHSKRVETIHNGFDEEDYSESVPLTSKFTLTYTGGIYAGKRDPTPLFQALTELQQESRLSPGDFEVRFYGGSSLQSLLPIIKDYHLKELVKIYGLVPFRESISRQKESTALLLLEWNNPQASHNYSGKIFEYLGAHRPVLAIAYKTGAIDRLLRDTGAGVLANEVKAIKGVLSRWLEEWHKSGKITAGWNPDLEAINSYTRKKQAGKLAQLLEEVTAGGGS